MTRKLGSGARLRCFFPGGSLVGLSKDSLWVMELPQRLPTSTTAADLAKKAGTFLEDSAFAR